MKEWDVFISHASSDKHLFVMPLAEELRERGVRVWLDGWSIEAHGISKSMFEGLMASRFGIVVVSPAFLSRGWPLRELTTLLAYEAKAARILPIWFDMDPDGWKNHPFLAGRIAATSSEGIGRVADRVEKLLSSDTGP